MIARLEIVGAGIEVARGDWIGLVAGAWQKVSTADDPTAIALVDNVEEPVDRIRAVLVGEAELETELASGSFLYLSATPGVATDILPTDPGEVRQRLGVVLTARSVLVRQYPREVL